MAWTSKSEADNPWTAELDWDAENPSGVTTSQPIFDEATDQVVCLVVGTGWDEREFDQRVNLIAAAPDVLAELKQLSKAYVSLLESGRDRIVALGGDCDPVDVMERGNPWLRSAKEAIAKAEGRS